MCLIGQIKKMEEKIKQWLYDSLTSEQKEKILQYLSHQTPKSEQGEPEDAIYPQIYFVQGLARIPKGTDMTQLRHPQHSPEQLCNLGYF